MAITNRKKRKSAFQLWLMVALIVAIVAVLALPMGGNDSAAEPETENTVKSDAASKKKREILIVTLLLVFRLLLV